MNIRWARMGGRLALLLGIGTAWAQPPPDAPGYYGDRQTGNFGDPGVGNFGNPASGSFNSPAIKAPAAGQKPLGHVVSGPDDVPRYVTLPTPADVAAPPPGQKRERPKKTPQK
jgi:hypothetical protein